MIQVVRTHLEMRDRASLRPAQPPAEPAGFDRTPMTAGRYRALYTAVGGPWHWRDRLAWTDEQLDAYIALRGIFIWVLKVSGREAGYFELQQHSREHVEIVYFGLEPSFMGRGLGGWMLTRAAQEAFALGASRITLHTCTLDSAPALPNYLARGFSVVREECYFVNDDGSPL